VIVSDEALTNRPAGFSTLPYGMLALMAYCASMYPIDPVSLFTYSAISELRSVGTPTGHLGDGLVPTSVRNLELVFERNSVNT
jgi:hypothetical protein